MGDIHFMYLAGLDIGQSHEFTALAVVERTSYRNADDEEDEDSERRRSYAVRHLERFPLATPYTGIGARLAEIFREPPLKGSTLLVDQTAVGKPVVDVLKRADIDAYILPLALTAGIHHGFDGHGGWLVSKIELVSTLQVLLQSRRLKVAPTLPEAQTLVNELANFKMQPKLADTESLDAWREGPHDDLVLATAIAVWEGERYVPFRAIFIR